MVEAVLLRLLCPALRAVHQPHEEGKSALRRIFLCPQCQGWGSNPRPTVYDTVALPLSYPDTVIIVQKYE